MHRHNPLNGALSGYLDSHTGGTSGGINFAQLATMDTPAKPVEFDAATVSTLMDPNVGVNKITTTTYDVVNKQEGATFQEKAATLNEKLTTPVDETPAATSEAGAGVPMWAWGAAALGALLLLKKL